MSEWTTPGLEPKPDMEPRYVNFSCCGHCLCYWRWGHRSPCSRGCEPVPQTEFEVEWAENW